MGVHRNIDANFLRGVMPKVPSKKHPYENFGMPYVFLWILHCTQRAIEFGPIDALRKKYGSTAVAPLPPVTQTKPALAVHAPKNARPVGDDSGTVFLH